MEELIDPQFAILLAQLPDHPAVKRLGPYAMSNWPPGIEFPTEAEIDAAAKKMHEEANASYAKGYQGDWGFNLPFTMATYASFCWAHLFDRLANG